MAASPPDRPWQSPGRAGRDQGEARQRSTAWQPAQPPPQPPEQTQPEQREPREGYGGYPGYQGQQAAQGQHAAQGEQAGWTEQTGWRQPGQPGQAGQAGQQAAWQAQAYRRPAGKNKGFVASLFDFGFTSFVTPKVIKGLYVLGTAWTALWAILLFLIGLRFGHATFGTFIFLFIAILVFILLCLGTIRVTLEFFMALHRINENIQELRDRERRS